MDQTIHQLPSRRHHMPLFLDKQVNNSLPLLRRKQKSMKNEGLHFLNYKSILMDRSKHLHIPDKMHGYDPTPADM